MDIESELPEDFDELSSEEKIEELEELEEQLDENSDADLIKKRMIQELIRKYQD